MRAALLMVALAVLVAPNPWYVAPASEQAVTPYIEAELLSYCVPVLDFPEPVLCAGMYDTPVMAHGRVIYPVPFPASSHHFTRDFVSESWVIEKQ